MPERPERIDRINRATFLRRAGSLLAVAFITPGDPVRLMHAHDGLEHPEPREGITAELVLTVEALGTSRKPKVLEAYESARAYPALFDGVACGCSCGGKKGMHRSLLTCFETLQPTGCGACQEEAEIVGRLAREEKSLAEIRKAVDKYFS